MNPIRPLSQAFAETYRLEKRYFWLTSFVGLMGVCVGIAFMLMTASWLASLLGIEPNASLKHQSNGFLWFGIFLMCIPISIYLGVVIAAGLFSTVMVSLGKFTKSEAVRYTFLSRYPAYWFKR
jgi:hypothetical protein